MFVGSLYVCFMYRYHGHLLNEQVFFGGFFFHSDDGVL